MISLKITPNHDPIGHRYIKKLTAPATGLVIEPAREEKHVRTEIKTPFCFREAHREHKTPMAANTAA